MKRSLYNRLSGLSKIIFRNVAERGLKLPLAVPGAIRVLMYHRFCGDRNSNGSKMSASTFEWQLRVLNKDWHVIPLGDLFESLKQHRKLSPRTAVITVDDGYLDFYEIAYPILQKFNFPATFFPTLNFVEGRIWLWPDILSFILDETRKPKVSVCFDGTTFEFLSAEPSTKKQIWQHLSDFCSELPDQRKWEFIFSLADLAEVAIPERPVADYAPVNFTQIKEMSRNGIEIGAHTLNHPILSQVDANTLVKELSEPKRQFEERLNIEVRSLAYPSGRNIDINPSVVAAAKKSGYAGAVVTRREYGRHDTRDIFQLPRIGVGNDRADFYWKLHGLEFLTETIRSYLPN